jgi:hypothetical protein
MAADTDDSGDDNESSSSSGSNDNSNTDGQISLTARKETEKPEPDKPTPKANQSGMTDPATQDQPDRSAQEDPEKDLADTPKDPNLIADSPLKAKPLKTQEESNQRHMQAQIRAVRNNHERSEQSRLRYEQAQIDLQRQSERRDSLPPTPIALEQRPMGERQGATFLQFAFPAALMLAFAAMRRKP